MNKNELIDAVTSVSRAAIEFEKQEIIGNTPILYRAGVRFAWPILMSTFIFPLIVRIVVYAILMIGAPYVSKILERIKNLFGASDTDDIFHVTDMFIDDGSFPQSVRNAYAQEIRKGI